jgi:hypothetical protein
VRARVAEARAQDVRTGRTCTCVHASARHAHVVRASPGSLAPAPCPGTQPPMPAPPPKYTHTAPAAAGHTAPRAPCTRVCPRARSRAPPSH